MSGKCKNTTSRRKSDANFFLMRCQERPRMKRSILINRRKLYKRSLVLLLSSPFSSRTGQRAQFCYYIWFHGLSFVDRCVHECAQRADGIKFTFAPRWHLTLHNGNSLLLYHLLSTRAQQNPSVCCARVRFVLKSVAISSLALHPIAFSSCTYDMQFNCNSKSISTQRDEQRSEIRKTNYSDTVKLTSLFRLNDKCIPIAAVIIITDALDAPRVDTNGTRAPHSLCLLTLF